MLIDGKHTAQLIRKEVQGKVAKLKGRKPCLAVILVGDHPASKIYVNGKVKACNEVGFLSVVKRPPTSIKQDVLLGEITTLNKDPNIDGILIQMPLPGHIDSRAVIHAITPEKDVDGFHPINMGKVLLGESDGFIPCTPLGVLHLINRTGISPTGKHTVILGRSNIVGKPLAALLMQKSRDANATVTVLHSASEDIPKHTRRADILIAAMGSAQFVTADMVKEGAVVIDVGQNRITNNVGKSELVGDVDFDKVQEKASHITPVPGGVGPMTIAMLIQNTWKSYAMREGLEL